MLKGQCRPIAAHFTRLAIFHYLPLNGNAADTAELQRHWTTKGHFHSIWFHFTEQQFENTNQEYRNNFDEFDWIEFWSRFSYFTEVTFKIFFFFFKFGATFVPLTNERRSVRCCWVHGGNLGKIRTWYKTMLMLYETRNVKWMKRTAGHDMSSWMMVPHFGWFASRDPTES